MFPPQTGMTWSTWICVDKFSDPRTDAHCVRLLTLVRSPPSGRDLICLSAVLSARDKAIVVSTQETALPQSKLIFFVSRREIRKLTHLTITLT